MNFKESSKTYLV